MKHQIVQSTSTKTKITIKSLRCPSSSTSRPCRWCVASSLSRPDVLGCGWEVVERVKKTTSVLEMTKEEEPPMKLLDDPQIPKDKRSPQEPHHSHKVPDVVAEMGLKPGRLYWRRHHHHHLSVVPPNINPKTSIM